jgi:outer membrane protein TolC
MRRSALGLCLAISVLLPPAASAEDAPLTLAELPALVLGHDTAAAISAQTTLLAKHTYQGTIAQAMPQVDLTPTYSLAYTPDQKSQIASPPAPSVDVERTGAGTNLLGAKLSVTQLLPTAGSLMLTLENTTTVSAVASQSSTVLGTTTTTNPDPLYSQRPRLTLGLTQPLFLNGKVIDLDLFPATLRKAELGFLQQDLSNRNQRNQAIGQAVQLHLSIVQLRKSLIQISNSISVAQGNLDSLLKSFALGSVAEADLLDSKIALSRQRQGSLELSTSLRKAERLLAHAIGRDNLDGMALSEEIPRIAFSLGRQETIDRALAGHPLLKQRSLALEEKRVDQVLGGQQFASMLSLSFSWSPRYPYDPANTPYTSTDFGASFSDLFKDGWGQDYTLAAGLTLHLYDGGQEAERRAGTAALSAVADQGLVAQRQLIVDQIEQDLLQRASLEEKIALLVEAASLRSARLATEQNLLALGKSTDLDVGSRRADAEAKANDLWRARADLLLIVIDLYSLSGEDLANVIEGSNS